jgi:Na+-translocating ferredoxin:NAD+ oxidoreductase RnfD subunit
LLAGGVWLVWRRLIAWQIPAGFCLVLLVSLPLGTGWLLLQPALWLLLGWVMTDGNSTPITPVAGSFMVRPPACCASALPH